MIKSEYKYSELTGKIIGCGMEVQKILGNGFLEVIYQRAISLEFELQKVVFVREFEMPIYNKENHIGTRRAVIQLEDVHLAQAINYLEAYNLGIGLLLNFRAKCLELKKLINSKFKSNQSTNQFNHS